MPIIDKHTNTIDYAIQQNGSIAALFDVSTINGLSITDDLVGGNIILTPEGNYPSINATISILSKVETEILKKHQTFIDYATQHSGALDRLFEVAQLNGLGITQNVVPGTSLIKVVSNKRVVGSIKELAIDVVSNKDLGIEITIGGIGAMQIGNTFKTS